MPLLLPVRAVGCFWMVVEPGVRGRRWAAVVEYQVEAVVEVEHPVVGL